MPENAGANDAEIEDPTPPAPLLSKEDRARGGTVFQRDGFVWYWPPGGTEWELLVKGPGSPADPEPEKGANTPAGHSGITVPAGPVRPRPGRDARRDVMPAPGEVRRRAR